MYITSYYCFDHDLEICNSKTTIFTFLNYSKQIKVLQYKKLKDIYLPKCGYENIMVSISSSMNKYDNSLLPFKNCLSTLVPYNHMWKLGVLVVPVVLDLSYELRGTCSTRC